LFLLVIYSAGDTRDSSQPPREGGPATLHRRQVDPVDSVAEALDSTIGHSNLDRFIIELDAAIRPETIENGAHEFDWSMVGGV
jgi:hypothetical protein